MTTMLTTRRQFLGYSAALPFAWRAMALDRTTPPRWVFLGTDHGKGIYRAPWNPTTGELGTIELAAETDRPDFFALHPKLPVLYTVNSVGDGKGGVSSFRVNKFLGSLELINRVSSHGDGPCFVSVDLPRAWVANYSGGSVAQYGVRDDGALEEWGSFNCQTDKTGACGALGPVSARQDASHLHCTTPAPYGNIVVCDLADDAILIFKMSKEAFLDPPLRYRARRGSGPRHVAFHPNGKWMYCIHELDCTVDLYDWTVRGWKGVLKLRENSVISTLAKGTPLTDNTGCEISVSDDGRFVYTCSRGVDEIVVFRVDPATGLLTEQQRVSSGGKVPRYFALDPSRKWLVCCNQGAGKTPVGNVTVFAHDPTTGMLGDKPKTFAAETPMFTLFV